MKKQLALTLFVLTSNTLFANQLPTCNPGFGALDQFLINRFNLNSTTYHIQKDQKLSSSYSWGGTFNGNDANVYCVDGDQFVDIISNTNPEKYCIIDSGTELGSNHTDIYQNHGIQCHITLGAGQPVKVPYYGKMHDAIRYQDYISIT